MDMKEITNNMTEFEQLTDDGFINYYQNDNTYTCIDLKDKYDLFGETKTYEGTLKDKLYSLDLYHTKRVRIIIKNGETYEFRF